ncbi:MAG: hypothetical protein MSA90_18415 [Faecalicatena sp.]|uniref:hypothetical protein n=1 Tax=Faecalicatena sp. TaxID=2005360 RepID=UPI0025830A9E|nr:hypothetical protein [Faecalicatena sp.]MCI6467423.1 hypothetical protein [Faecalicatena sp.]MDY5618121.1 hypothetical protein [Lachnospiraceae bacterium]
MHILGIRPELILYFYMAGCIAVLIYNIGYIFWDRRKGKRLEKQSLDMVDKILMQIQKMTEDGSLTEEGMSVLKRDLRKLERLRAFEYSLEKVKGRVSAEEYACYITGLRGVFLDLAFYYSRRDLIEKAYFASLIKKFGIDRGHAPYDGLMDFLVTLVIGPDVYARENALGALYSIGNQEAVLAAWEKMEDNGILHSVKLLADGLLGFCGDRHELAKLLFAHRAKFSGKLNLPVMQFIRFSDGGFQEEFLELLKKENEDKELRLEAVRYFRRYPYEPAREVLFNFLRYQEYIDWEYAAMAALALSSYPGIDTQECLKQGLSAANWYVRFNCAQSLIYGLKVPQLRLYDVYNGHDRYAREILKYVSELQEIEDQQIDLEEIHV